MQLIKTILTFLENRWDKKSPLLLGYSGGPDSKALLYALLQAGVRSLHLAHVDHGWRTESGREAELILQEARQLGLVCHVHKLTEHKKGNLEEEARLARLRFFQKLFEETPFQALLLAHHAGDLAETTLKRLFEGAHLCNLGGMAEEGTYENMRVWRPLLGTSKKDLGHFLEQQSLLPFIDATNEDRRFLRARLRRDAIPTLEIFFGKKIASNLEALSIRSHELKVYLDKQIEPLWEERVEGPWGGRIDLTGVDRIVLRHLLQQKIFPGLSREALEDALDARENGMFFWTHALVPQFLEPVELKEGIFSSGDWHIEVTPLEGKKQLSWQEIWTGTFEAALPDGVLQMASSAASFREAWRVQKVPHCLRGKWPVVHQKEKMWDLLDLPDESEVQWRVCFKLLSNKR